jgi:xanthine/uracil permease
VLQGKGLYERIQGGLLGDGLSSLFAALATTLPNTTFSQNNGVISLTRCELSLIIIVIIIIIIIMNSLWIFLGIYLFTVCFLFCKARLSAVLRLRDVCDRSDALAGACGSFSFCNFAFLLCFCNAHACTCRCAARQAGLFAAGWLLLMGIFSKVAAFFATIPDCVLGGMTTFLFASVTISGAHTSPLTL